MAATWYERNPTGKGKGDDVFYDVPRFKSIILKKLNRRTAHFLPALHFGLMTPIPLKRMTSLNMTIYLILKPLRAVTP